MSTAQTMPPPTAVTKVLAPTWQLVHGVDEALRIDRVAGTSADVLDISMTHSDELAARLDEIDRTADRLRETVSDALYQLVPKLDDDRDLRRTTLNARRQTQKAAAKPLKEEQLAPLLHQLREHHLDADAVAAWNALLDERCALEAQFADTVAAEVEHATEALETLRNDEEFLTAVADASPAFAAAPGKSTLTPRRHTTRSLLAYAGRSALKPSPFGRLTRVGYAQGTTVPDAQVAEISHSYAAAWLDVLARDRLGCHALEVEPMNLGGIDPRLGPVPVGMVEETPEFVWRRTAPVHLRSEALLLERLQEHGRIRVTELLERLGSDPYTAYLQLLDAGLLRTVTPWAANDHHALETLCDHLEARIPIHPFVSEIRAILDDTRVMLRSTGSDRGRIRAELQRTAERALELRGVSRGRRRFEVYLDVAPREPARPIPSELIGDLNLFVQQCHPTARSGAYRLVVDDFVRRYGVGGAAPSLWQWIAAAGIDDEVQMAMASPQTQQPDTSTRELRRGASMPRPSAAIALQCVDSTEPVAVINQVLAGQGGLIARFTRLHDGVGGLSESLCDRAEALTAPAKPFEVVPSADVNGMQAAAAGTITALAWPTALPAAASAPQTLRPEELNAKHDPETDSIVITDASGQLLAPVYFGLVPAHLGGGPERILSILADPWQRPRVGLPVYPVLADPNEVRSFARRQAGRVVIRRAAWTVPKALLPEHDGDSAILLRRVGRWRRELEMPAEVFVRIVRERVSLTPNARKPVWINLRSAHSIEHLYSLLDDDVTGFEFTEALPASTEHPHGSDGARRAIEHLIFVDWTEEMDG